MISMNINAGQDKISQSVLRDLKKNADKVIIDATNRTLIGMRTDATKLIVKESSIVRKTVFSAFYIVKASSTVVCQNARVDIFGNPVGLVKFKYNPKKTKVKNKNGVQVNIAQKTVKFKHAFVATMKNGHTGIFERQKGVKTSSNREKIQEKFGPSIPQLAARQHIVQTVQIKAEERFIKRFEQQSRRFLSRSGAR